MANKNNPALIIREIIDIYVRKNFELLQKYFQEQNQFLDFKFFEIEFTAAEANRKVAHGLGLVPADVVVSKITGNSQVDFNFGLFDSTNIDITVSGPCRLRFYVGRYWNDKSSGVANKDDVMTYFGSSSSPVTSSSTTKAPTVTRLSGSGSYKPPKGVKYLVVEMVGGGAGGSGSGTASFGAGGAGGNSTFGQSFLIAYGGSPANIASGVLTGGSGGGTLIASSISIIRQVNGGGGGSGCFNNSTGTVSSSGGIGGSSNFGGAGFTSNAANGGAAARNSGSGGGGGGSNTTNSSQSGGGGGSGGYLKVLITKIEESYNYSVASGGAGGSAGTLGFAGGAGGSGNIIIEEYY